MLNSVLGKKIGMSQIFTQKGEVIPVTVIDVANLFVTQIKTPQGDGYAALQLGILRNRYKKEVFSIDWLKNKKKHFCHLREVSVQESELAGFKLGQKVDLDGVGLQSESLVKITGTSRGLGFQGVVKRWGFAGGPASHGSTFHRAPGSIGNMCSQGNVIKGKKLPGHMGNKQVTVKGLKVVHLDKKDGCLFVKGTIPGKKDSLVIVCKQG